MAVVVLGLAPATAQAAKGKIEVRPGPDAIADALDRAKDGQVLRIHRGRYDEALTIGKRVKLVGVGKRRPVVDAGCATPTTIEVQADGVRLNGLKVVGAATATEVNFIRVSGGRASELVLRDTCDAEYGINVNDTGPMAIVKSKAFGFDDAGFYIGAIRSTPGGSIRLARSESFDNLRGVIVEDSAGGDIRIRRNLFTDNDVFVGELLPTGALITKSEGVLVEENAVTDNGTFGLRLTPDSSGNRINDNLLLGNPVDIRNEGSGNCGAGNEFLTGDTLPPC